MRGLLKFCLVATVLILSGLIGFGCGWKLCKTVDLGAYVSSDTYQEDMLDTFRSERRQFFQTQISQLNELIHGNDMDAQIEALAQEKLLELMECAEREMTLEGMLKLRGFEDATVVLHADSGNVMLRSDSLNAQQCNIILELVTRETGISAGNVKIIPIN